MIGSRKPLAPYGVSGFTYPLFTAYHNELKSTGNCSKRAIAGTWQGVTIQILSGRLQFFLRSIQTAFWPAAPLRRTSVLPQAKPWRRANSLRPSISITEGWSDQRERNPKENATCRNKSHFLLAGGNNFEPWAYKSLAPQRFQNSRFSPHTDFYNFFVLALNRFEAICQERIDIGITRRYHPQIVLCPLEPILIVVKKSFCMP